MELQHETTVLAGKIRATVRTIRSRGLWMRRRSSVPKFGDDNGVNPSFSRKRVTIDAKTMTRKYLGMRHRIPGVGGCTK